MEEQDKIIRFLNEKWGVFDKNLKQGSKNENSH
jgi:hypothetical protein